jgi:D-inositol-3-phosphate glycosyltransferase
LGHLREAIAWRLRAVRLLLGRDAPGRLAAFTAPPPPPEPPATGRIDAPFDGARLERGAIAVSGWVLFRQAGTARVELGLGGKPLGLAELGVGRADLAANFDQPGAAIAGFQLAADLEDWPLPDGPTTLTAVATSVDGERFELPPVGVELKPRPAAEASPPRPPLPARRRPGWRLMVCTHQLSLGGAARVLGELLGELRQYRVDPVVVSALGGPLRPQLEAMGIPVHVSGPPPLDDVEALDGRAEEIRLWAEQHDFKLALVNSSSPLTIGGAEAAGRLGIPVVWSVHESFPPPVLWAGCAPAVCHRLERTLGAAELVLFQTAESRRAYEHLLRGRSLTVPYGLDLAAIDRLRADFDREAERRRRGIPVEAELIVCVGAIEPRKAQAQLAGAFTLIADRHPRARLALVGAGETTDSRMLARWVAASPARQRIELVPSTPEIEPWYGIADVVACPSRFETLPRAVLEALPWGTPVLASDILSLPEVIEDGVNGWLCPAGDTQQLAHALERVLGIDPAERARIGAAGRRLAEERYDLRAYGTRMAALLEELASDRGPGSRRG